MISLFIIPTSPTVKSSDSQMPVLLFFKLENSTYTFETKEHDFPQRVIYILPENNTLHAWIDGDVNGRVKKSIYNYIRVQ